MRIYLNYILFSKALTFISRKLNWINLIPIHNIIYSISYRKILRLKKNQLLDAISLTLGDVSVINVSNICINDLEIIRQLADKALNYEFDILGTGNFRNYPINWHTDFKSKKVWDKGIFFKRYKIIDLKDVSDVKVPWEISRCHHLLWLGEAYLLSNDDKYAKSVLEYIEDWIENNPYLFSINWTCAMDVSIRAVNWIYALNMIKNSSCIQENQIRLIYKSLFQHSLFITKNLEKWYPYSGNHYAANIVGLLHLAHLFKHLNFEIKWYNHILNEFYLEIRTQILPTGPHFERTISYHRLTTEFFAYTFVLLERNNVSIPIDIKYRIESMFSFIDNYTKPTGLSPLIGDNDDGRFLPFVKRDFRDHRYLMNFASLMFNKPFVNTMESTPLDIVFLFTDQRKLNTSKKCSQTNSIHDHRDAGFIIYKSNEFYIFISNSSLSSYPDYNKTIFISHTHSDNLSFELSYRGIDFIIDPGTYTYSSSKTYRNYFRSVKRHNTISIDQKEKIKFSSDNIFAISEFIEPSIFKIEESEGHKIITGKYTWGNSQNNYTTHNRVFKIINDCSVEINDSLFLSDKEMHRVYWNFTIAQDINVELDNNCIKLISNKGMSLEMKFNTDKKIFIEVNSCDFSPSYGVLSFTKNINISLEGYTDFNMLTEIIVSE